MRESRRIVALIQARCTSTRLPKKHLRLIGDKQLMDWIVDKLKGINELDEIVISTTADPSDHPLVQYAQEKGISVFCYDGDINDVVGRHYAAAKSYQADVVAVISGDCPLIDEVFIKDQIQKVCEGYDYVRGKQACLHEGIDTYSSTCVEYIHQNSHSPYERENFGILIREDLTKARVGWLDIAEKFQRKDFRISVDNMADLRFMNALYDQLNRQQKEFTLSNVVALVDQNPGLKNIHGHVRQKRKGEKTYQFIVWTEASQPIGLGHLKRMLVLGKYLNEERNHGVFYAINDDRLAENILHEEGYIYDYQTVTGTKELIQAANRLDADVLIIDVKTFQLGKEDFKQIKQETGIQKTIVIDQYIESGHVDLFLMQGVQSESFEERFEPLNNVLWGWDCVFIRKEFEQVKKRRIFQRKKQEKKKMVLSFGGTDPHNFTVKTLQQIKEMEFHGQYEYKIILGPYYPSEDALMSVLETFPNRVEIIKNPPNIAEELVDVDLGIIAYGVSFYEFLYLGIPTILCAQNQGDQEIIKRLEKQNLAVACGDLEEAVPRAAVIEIQNVEVGNLDRIYPRIIP